VASPPRIVCALVILVIGACAPEPPSADETGGVVLDTGSEVSSGAESGDDTFDDCSEDSGEWGMTSGEIPPECEEGLSACQQPVLQTYLDCMAACPVTKLSCDEAACSADCELERNLAELACQDAHCTDSWDDDECTRECWLDYSSCIVPRDCNLHGCQWDLGPCLTSCLHCIIPVELDFAFSGNCELPLPEPLYPMYVPYTGIELGDQLLGVVDADTPCGDPQVGATLQDDVLLLCPAACDAFTQAGLLRVVISGPSCP
jgi:hypothetical protein